MADSLSKVSTRKTPQSEQAGPRQVPNSAGGFTFSVGKAGQLHRFLTLGTEGGTYYTSAQALTKENAGIVLDYARNATRELVRQAVEISQAGRAPRNNPALFALAAASGLGDDAGRKYALEQLPLVARTGTHLFDFVGYAENFRGWGRGMRRAVANWYLQADDEQKIAYQMLKYRQRNGWTHRDMMRLAHPEHRQLFRWVTGHADVDVSELPPLVEAFMRAQSAATVKEWRPLIQANPSLSWEMLPDAALGEPEVWRALIEQGMPQTALMRQLPRLTKLGVLKPMSEAAKVVADQLADPERLRKGRVHPVNVLIALRTYASGHGMRGSMEWSPVSQITDALDAAFYAAYGAIEPAGKRTMLALDVSGSMGSEISGLPITCREATAALSLVTAATEPHTMTVGFTSAGGNWANTGLSTLDISPRQRMDDVLAKISGLSFGGTDCALPMLEAAKHKWEIDTFITLTDNETWAGTSHPHQALEAYRQKMGIPARLVVVGMTATDFTIADPSDPGSLDVAGFDSAVPSLVSDFSAGRI